MRSGGLVAVVGLLALAACSGDDDTAGSTTLAPPPSSTTTTTTDAPPPSGAPTTEDTTTTTPETTTTEATTPPTAPDTTLDPDDPVANTLAIIETVERSFRVYNAALNDPFDDEKVAALSEVFTPRLVEGWMNIIDEYRDDNLRSLPNPDIPARYDVDVNSVEVNLASGTASVQVCHLNTFVEVETGGNPDGTDRVVDDAITQQVEQLELLLVDGTWKVNRASLPDEADRTAQCD